MLKWAVVFLVVALITGYIGFKPVNVDGQRMSQVLFGIFALLFIIFLILALIKGNPCAI
jgi:uncharacterized membrane protein YtjA (UPF0391 family)